MLLKYNKINESMTKQEVIFKRNVLQYLRETGFPTFADYLKNFHFNFLRHPPGKENERFVAAIAEAYGLVFINPQINKEAVSVVLRHEAGHAIFKHSEHLIAKLKKLGIDNPSELAHDLSNVAGDYHISNVLYDKDDYYTAKNVYVDGEIFPGMVTELDFPENPEYWTMDWDQLWDVFVKKYKREDLENKVAKISDEFIEGYNQLVDDYNSGKITKEQLEAVFNNMKIN